MRNWISEVNDGCFYFVIDSELLVWYWRKVSGGGEGAEGVPLFKSKQDTQLMEML